MDPVPGREARGKGVLSPLDCADEVFGEWSFKSVDAEILTLWVRAQACLWSYHRIGPVMRGPGQLGNSARKKLRKSLATGGKDYSEQPSHNKRIESRGLHNARNRWDGLAGHLRMMVEEIY